MGTARTIKIREIAHSLGSKLHGGSLGSTRSGVNYTLGSEIHSSLSFNVCVRSRSQTNSAFECSTTTTAACDAAAYSALQRLRLPSALLQRAPIALCSFAPPAILACSPVCPVPPRPSRPAACDAPEGLYEHSRPEFHVCRALPPRTARKSSCNVARRARLSARHRRWRAVYSAREGIFGVRRHLGGVCTAGECSRASLSSPSSSVCVHASCALDRPPDPRKATTAYAGRDAGALC